MKPCGRVLIQHDSGPSTNRRWGHRREHRKEDVRRQGDDGSLGAEGGASEGTCPADTLILNLHPPQLWESKPLLPQQPSPSRRVQTLDSFCSIPPTNTSCAPVTLLQAQGCMACRSSPHRTSLQASSSPHQSHWWGLWRWAFSAGKGAGAVLGVAWEMTSGRKRCWAC